MKRGHAMSKSFREGLIAMLSTGKPRQREREYKSLHAELRTQERAGSHES